MVRRRARVVHSPMMADARSCNRHSIRRRQSTTTAQPRRRRFLRSSSSATVMGLPHRGQLTPVEKVRCPEAAHASAAIPKTFPEGKLSSGGRLRPHSGHTKGTGLWPCLRCIARATLLCSICFMLSPISGTLARIRRSERSLTSDERRRQGQAPPSVRQSAA